MIYSFDTEIAEKYGVGEAIIIQNLIFWIKKNKANGSNFYDGRTWTYNSLRAWKELFPFWNVGQIRRLLENLIEKGIILTGNYNSTQHDRTLWYAFSNECIFRKRKIDLPKTENRFAENGKSSIADSKPDSKPDSKANSKTYISLPNADNIKITQDEYNHLLDEFGKPVITKKILDLDNYIENGKGQKYKNHYKVILTWLRKDGVRPESEKMRGMLGDCHKCKTTHIIGEACPEKRKVQ
jgi:hypothetical protein